jgi:hypothetical protein
MNLTLRAVMAENWPQVAALQVRSEQTAWVASNLYALAEAAYGLPGESAHPVITPLAIYVDESDDLRAGFARGLKPCRAHCAATNKNRAYQGPDPSRAVVGGQAPRSMVVDLKRSAETLRTESSRLIALPPAWCEAPCAGYGVPAATGPLA